MILQKTITWCRRRDSNSHDYSSQPPQGCVSTNSTTTAFSEAKLRTFNYFGISWVVVAGTVALALAAGAAVFTTAFFSAIALTTLPLPSL
jgi:hypothetical protein